MNIAALFSADTRMTFATILRYLQKDPVRMTPLIQIIETGNVLGMVDLLTPEEAMMITAFLDKVKADTESVAFIRAVMKAMKDL